MRAGRRGQNALELMMLLGFLFIVLLGFFIVIQSKIHQEQTKQRLSTLSQLADIVEQELALGATVADGYMRSFRVPVMVNDGYYTLELEAVTSDAFVIRQDQSPEYLRYLDTPVRLVRPAGDITTELLPADSYDIIVENNGSELLIRKDCVAAGLDLDACAANP